MIIIFETRERRAHLPNTWKPIMADDAGGGLEDIKPDDDIAGPALRDELAGGGVVGMLSHPCT